MSPPSPWESIGVPEGHEHIFESVVDSRLAEVPEHIKREITSAGLRLFDQSQKPTCFIKKAATWIDRVPILARVCIELVHDLHLLQADDGYDISHSEPQWRRRIFVSVPERTDPIGELRLAESIVHETMHLQLTDQEAIKSLVVADTARIFSPWRSEHRPIQGVMHGLYVFSCLRVFFMRLVGQVEDELVEAYLRDRVADIGEEIRSIDMIKLMGGLTEHGASLVKSWKVLAFDETS